MTADSSIPLFSATVSTVSPASWRLRPNSAWGTGRNLLAESGSGSVLRLSCVPSAGPSHVSKPGGSPAERDCWTRSRRYDTLATGPAGRADASREFETGPGRGPESEAVWSGSVGTPVAVSPSSSPRRAVSGQSHTSSGILRVPVSSVPASSARSRWAQTGAWTTTQESSAPGATRSTSAPASLNHAATRSSRAGSAGPT